MNHRLSKLCCLLSAIYCAIYLIVIPPFESPDEPAHFLRAFGITEGQFILKDNPRKLITFIQKKMPRHEESLKQMLDDILSQNEDRIPNLAFNTALYSPIPYLGYALFIKLSGATTLTPKTLTASFYLSRLLSFSLFIILIFSIMRLSSTLKWPLLWMASTPMVLAQACVINIDILLFFSGMSILIITLEHIQTWKGISFFIATAAVLLMTKPVYAPIFLIPFTALMIGDAADKSKMALCLCLGVGVALIPALYWNHIIRTKGVWAHCADVGAMAGYGKADSTLQLNRLMADPLLFFEIILNTLHHHGRELYHQFVGVFSWLDTPLPFWCTWLWGAASLPALFLVDPKELDALKQRRYLLGAACIVAALISSALVCFSGYLIWMGVGAEVVLLQGRYFHVMAACTLLGFALMLPPISISRSVRNRMKVALIVSAFIVNASGIYVLIDKFWI